MEIKDVVIDFMDGKMLLNMMEVFCNIKLVNVSESCLFLGFNLFKIII